MMKLKFSSSGMTLIEVVVAVAIVAILSAIAIPAYGGYATRGRVSECINLIAPAKLAVSMRSTTFTFSPTPYCASIVVHPDGVIVATTRDTGAGVDPVLQLTPTFAGSVSWHCGLVTGNYADVPPICRNQPTAATGGNLAAPATSGGTAPGAGGAAPGSTGGSQGASSGADSASAAGGSGSAAGGNDSGHGGSAGTPPASGGDSNGSSAGASSGGSGSGSTGGSDSSGGSASEGGSAGSSGGGAGATNSTPLPTSDPGCKPKKSGHGNGHGRQGKPGSCKKNKH